MKEEYREQYRKFGLNVVCYRKKLRVTQLELAELLDIQRSHISARELGNVGVSFDLLFSKIARKDDCKDYYNTIKVLSGHKQGK